MPDPTDPRAEDQDALTHLDLLDPVVVHLNMLRGRIAKLTDAQIRHLHPQLFAGTDPRAEVDKDWQVKPLEWEDFDGRGAKATAMLIASYLITRWSDGRFEISVSAPGYSTGFDGERFHPTLEAAKAASQADYDRKILARLTRFVAAHPALGYDPECPECKGTGQRDSGGTHPWGEPAMMMCDCDAPPRAVADESIAEMRIAINRVPLDPALAAEIASEVTQFLDGAAQAPTVADDPSGIVQQMPGDGDDALKPCPFCGCDKVVIFYDHPESVGPSIGGGFYISHPLWREYPQSWGCQAVPSNGYFQTEQEAIAAWNRRAALSPETDGGQDG